MALAMRALGALAVCTLAACPRGPSRHEGAAVDVFAAAGGRQAPPPSSVAQGAAGAPQPGAARVTANVVATTAGKPSPSTTSATADKRSSSTTPPLPANAAPADLVTIHVLVEPPQRAHVIWGAKDFGLGPLDIRRPRGSGPLDLLVHAPGYLTLHTRAFTDRDNTLSVRLVPEAEAPRFPGYRAPSPSVTGHAPPPPLPRGTTARAIRPGKPALTAAAPADAPSDGAGVPRAP
jgi:hypothetical protein